MLLEDLQTAYRAAAAGVEASLPLKTTSFKAWSERLTELGRSGTLESELDYWLSEDRQAVTPLPVDHVGGENLVASARVVRVSLSAEETRALLQDVAAVFGTQINDALLAALGRAFSEWTSSPRLLVDLEGHGREEIFEDVDVTRTVGWFTTRFPVILESRGTSAPADALREIADQLRRVPRRGIGYGVLRYLGSPETAGRLLALPQPEVSFNYLGQFDQTLPEGSLFRPASENAGPTRSLRAARRHMITVDGRVVGGRLQFSFGYSERLHRASTIEGVAGRFRDTLASLAASASEGRGKASPDFLQSDMSAEDLETLLGQIRSARVP